MVRVLAEGRAAELLAASYTYAEVGATATDLPPGYRHVTRRRVLRADAFDAAVESLMTWQVHERAGLSVAASAGRAVRDAVVEMRLGVGPLGVRIPCRVVYVLDEPQRVGFAYGTLPGHPEAGEERFVVERDAAGAVAFSIAAFSKPATRLARAGGPLARWVQSAMTTRYAQVVDWSS